MYDVNCHKEVVYDICIAIKRLCMMSIAIKRLCMMCFAIKRLYTVPRVQFGGTCSCFQHLQWLQCYMHQCYSKDVRISIRRVFIKDRYLVSSTEYKKQIQYITF